MNLRAAFVFSLVIATPLIAQVEEKAPPAAAEAQAVDQTPRLEEAATKASEPVRKLRLITNATTLNYIPKYVDGAGTLGDSTVYQDAAGRVGIGTTSPKANLHVYSEAAGDAIAGFGYDPSYLGLGAAMNIGYAGNSYGRGAGFFNVRPDSLAVAPNPSLRFGTADVQRMIITNTGWVGVGTTTPQQKLHVFANEDAGTLIQVENTNAGSGAHAAFRTTSSLSATSYSAHGNRPSSLIRFGIPLAGWGEIVNFNGNGYIIGTTLSTPLVFGTADAERMRILGNGYVGIGTSAPLAPLHINGAISQSQLYVTNNTLNTGVLSALAYATDNVSLGFDVDWASGANHARSPTVAWLSKYGGHFVLRGSGNNTVNGTPVFNTYQDTDLTTGVTEFRTTAPNTSAKIAAGMIHLTGYPTQVKFGNGQFIQDDGTANMRIFAGANLTVATNAGGDIVMAPGSTNFRVTGNIITTGNITGAKVIGAVYQDLAEWVPATSDMTPGTVVVLNLDKTNEVMPSSRQYDTSVAGVVSASPGIILGVAGDSKEQIATTGRVKVRVDARTKPVRVGDLLVTSDVLGTAMRSEPMEINGRQFHQPGTIIGKALEPLEGGVGEILVLLSMQ